MQKGLGIGIAVILVVVLIAVFWMFRGQPAGETLLPVPPTATPLDGTGRFPSPTASADTGGLPGVGSPQASPTVPTSGATVSIATTGFSPATVSVPVNGTVTFTNSDTQSHQVSSDPHPIHTNYPPLNGDVLAPGQSRTVTFTQAGTFGYHDHLNPGLRGTVTVR
ncbi:MAG: plastocyanin-like protein [Parcubacteria group bacterium Gr01-1014_38]|nr:MAG: plastocyanin-like protein [Parcubacteria group bacterium Gr01-1014_38]